MISSYRLSTTHARSVVDGLKNCSTAYCNLIYLRALYNAVGYRIVLNIFLSNVTFTYLLFCVSAVAVWRSRYILEYYNIIHIAGLLGCKKKIVHTSFFTSTIHKYEYVYTRSSVLRNKKLPSFLRVLFMLRYGLTIVYRLSAMTIGVFIRHI